MATTTIHLNGNQRDITADLRRSLLSILRDDLSLTGCKYGCGEGECGACTVLIDGQPTRSCITSVADCAGKKITTIEGLASGKTLHPLQAAFIECNAMQCGYCTTGMIMSGVALLQKNAKPSRDQIVEHMDGNICRCGAYTRIIAAVERASGLATGGAS